MSTPIDDIVYAILEIDTRDDLDRVVEAAKTRRQQLAVEFAASLRIGDRVRIRHRIEPDYLAGLTGVVVAPATGERAQIRPDNRGVLKLPHLQADGAVHVPTSAIERLAPAGGRPAGGDGAGEESGR